MSYQGTVAIGALLIGVIFYVRLQFQNRPRPPLNMEQFQGLPRLPRTGVPQHYELELRPGLDACKFDGKLEITLDVTEKTKYLVLNALDLVIKDGSVWLCPKDSKKLSFDLLEKWLSKHPEALMASTEKSLFKELALYQDCHGLEAFRKAMASFMEALRR